MVAEARTRSGDRCECVGQCGLDHSKTMVLAGQVEPDPRRCQAMNGQPHPTTKSRVVLTLAHEHGVELEETSIARMFHACQQCHNRYDAPVRRAGIKERQRAAVGCDDLFIEKGPSELPEPSPSK